MNIVAELKERFRPPLSELVGDPAPLLSMIRATQNPRFGDYQMNCAMPLEKQLGRPAREVAEQIVDQLEVADLCECPEIAGKGFINLAIRTEWIQQALNTARRDQRLGVAAVDQPRTYVVDYSSPNVAKPMHVGHIRSTVLGDAIARLLRFRGHRVIRDNHLGDWGTQFGMVLYGYRHFADRDAYHADPVAELARLYRVVRRLMDYHEAQRRLPELAETSDSLTKQVARQEAEIEECDDKSQRKALNKALRRLVSQQEELREKQDQLRSLVADIDASDTWSHLAADHPDIGEQVLEETAKLHAGDPERTELWHEFLPECRAAIQQVYERLGIEFDIELGESFYHDRLAGVVRDLEKREMATVSDGATCLFLEGFDAPMIVRKRDGAFLYATTDLATIQYRMEMWSPDAILYVVDFRQSEHFDKLFAATRRWGFTEVELTHVKFGTVLGNDGKPFKTRSGDTVGLESLLDDAVAAALQVVEANDLQKSDGPEFSSSERDAIANTIGHAAIKYADLSQNRESDYVYHREKMVAMKGNTATYMQYSYARIQNILSKGEIDIDALRHDEDAEITLAHAAERRLGLQLLRFEQAIDDSLEDYRPHVLTEYLFELSKDFSDFYHDCPVLKAENELQRTSRILLCDLVGRTVKQGLELLGISVIDRM